MRIPSNIFRRCKIDEISMSFYPWFSVWYCLFGFLQKFASVCEARLRLCVNSLLLTWQPCMAVKLWRFNPLNLNSFGIKTNATVEFCIFFRLFNCSNVCIHFQAIFGLFWNWSYLTKKGRVEKFCRWDCLRLSTRLTLSMTACSSVFLLGASLCSIGTVRVCCGI